MNNKIIIIAGDPNSINSELIFKSFTKLNKSLKEKIYLIGSYDLLMMQFKKLKYKLKLKKVKNILEKDKDASLKVINLNLKFKNPFKVNINEASKYVAQSLNLAHKIAIKNKISGIINCPINKNLLYKKKTGVTEYLARKCKIYDNSEVMLIFNKELSVTPVTTHIDIKNVSKKISANNIVNKSKTINYWFKKKIFKKTEDRYFGS